MKAEAEAILKHLGLTEYEARAIAALIEYGSMPAERISAMASIPLPRVYDTMKSLAGRGLVIVSNTRPQTFRAIEPKRFIDLLKEDERRRADDRLKEIDNITPQFMKIIASMPTTSEMETTEIFATVKKKANMDKIREEYQTLARKEILIFAGDLSWVPSSVRNIRRIVQKGIKYRILWDKSDGNVVSNVRKALSAGAELRFYGDTGNLRCIIVDDDRVSIALKIPTEGSPKSVEYTTLTINNKLLTDVFRRYFLALWDKAMPAEKWLAKAARK
ncbi:MAG: hypothetical protein KQA33_00010 [Candidatus Aenigmarchaeota archaeon]|nr:hypothetical protein [Candidatus Aenigmarchaeota archaeon]